ncbi:MAG: hypothetical protein IIA83_11550 [Thaumarchaeota archaeon]|nr:hypothetical protein [Nitrososphaerota archaeon]
MLNMGYFHNHLATVVCGIFAAVLSLLWVIMTPMFPVLGIVFLMAVPITWFLVFICWIAQKSNDWMMEYHRNTRPVSTSDGKPT